MTPQLTRKAAAVGIAALAAVTAAGAYAGNMNLTSPARLGAGGAPVQASCTASTTTEPATATFNADLKAFAFESVVIAGAIEDCAYNEATVTIFNGDTNAILAEEVAPHVITTAEAAAGSFSVTLDAPVNAGVSSDTIRYAVKLSSSVPHDAVTNINMSAAYYGMGLSWTPPTDDGAVEVTGYKIEYAVNNAGTPGAYQVAVENTYSSAPSYGVYGLTPGTQYWFRITAWNLHGLSAASASAEAANGVVPYTTPGAPTSVSASGGGVGQLNVTWNAPASNGYTAITSYQIQTRKVGTPDFPGNWSTTNTGSTATSGTVSGLTPGDEYYVRVAAINTAGAGTNGTAGSTAFAGE